MRRFDYSFLKERAWDNEIVGYLSQIHEQKGRQNLFIEAQRKLKLIRQIAVLESKKNDIVFRDLVKDYE